ncbi:MAG: hypothetical protein AB7P23_05590 [Amphiplicatus sp.]
MNRRERRRQAALSNAADPGPVEERYRAQMNALAKTLDEFLNGKDCKPEELPNGRLKFLRRPLGSTADYTGIAPGGPPRGGGTGKE